MTTLSLGLIVEGQGEVKSAHILTRRIANHISPGSYIDPNRPIRVKRDRFLNNDQELSRAVNLARLNAINGQGAPHILILLDADSDCPKQLADTIREKSRTVVSDIPTHIVFAKCEYEAWFIAAAESLRNIRGLASDLSRPTDPESIRGAKGWLARKMGGSKSYSETTDQPALTSAFDLELAEKNSRSFRKLIEDIRSAYATP